MLAMLVNFFSAVLHAAKYDFFLPNVLKVIFITLNQYSLLLLKRASALLEALPGKYARDKKEKSFYKAITLPPLFK